MLSLYTRLRRCWHTIPSPVQRALVACPGFEYGKDHFARWSARSAHHDQVYDVAYFDKLDAEASYAANNMAQSIVQLLNPSSVLDVGCGTGALLDALRRYGVIVSGLEYSEAGLARCRQRGLAVQKFDIENHSLAAVSRVEVVTSFEVAEHLPAACADKFVDLLVTLSDTIIMTAATPGQGGTDHVNEQPHEYWIDKIETRGFSFLRELSMDWRHRWSEAGIATFYYKNVMIFRKGSQF
jgi:cyclopropane fatty-acyl-phospholipid synthase-like methyltransferase